MRVLVVDDDPLTGELLADLVEELGNEAVIAEDGLTALTVARQTQPDVILMDLRLPILDGVEAIRQLKADSSTRHIPTVAMSASEFLFDCLEHTPVEGYLPKPFSLHDALIMLASLEALTDVAGFHERARWN